MEIAIVVNEINRSQMFFDIYNQSKKIALTVYVNKENYLNQNFNFTTLTYYDLWNSNSDNYIATCINSASKLLESPKIKNFYFYVWNLEWISKIIDYESYSKIYRNKKIQLVARSLDHKKIIDKIWNVDCLVSENFSLDFVWRKNEKINI